MLQGLGTLQSALTWQVFATLQELVVDFVAFQISFQNILDTFLNRIISTFSTAGDWASSTFPSNSDCCNHTSHQRSQFAPHLAASETISDLNFVVLVMSVMYVIMTAYRTVSHKFGTATGCFIIGNPIQSELSRKNPMKINLVNLKQLEQKMVGIKCHL